MKKLNQFVLAMAATFLFGSNVFAQEGVLDFKDIGSFLITRAHQLNLDGITADMKPGTKRKFIAGFSAEGALVYQYELNEQKMKDWNESGGRNAGMQLLPYSVQVMQNGAKKVSFSAFAFRNMNKLQESEHAYENLDKAGVTASFWKIIDRLDALTVTWDYNYSFNNIRSFDFDLVNAVGKIPFAKNSTNTTTLSVRLGGNVGLKSTNVKNMHSLGYGIRQNIVGFKGEYLAGLELNMKAKRGIHVNVQSSYLSGASQIYVRNLSIRDQNRKNTQEYEDQKVKSFENYLAQTAINHQEYLDQLNLYYQSPDYIKYLNEVKYMNQIIATTICYQHGVLMNGEDCFKAVTGKPIPVPPATPTEVNSATMTEIVKKENINPEQKLRRSYGYLKFSTDVTFPITHKHRAHPVSLGVGADVNLAIYDRVENKNKTNFGSAMRIDFKGNYNQVFRGRVYLNF